MIDIRYTLYRLDTSYPESVDLISIIQSSLGNEVLSRRGVDLKSIIQGSRGRKCLVGRV
jgi:hypothetical protein